MNQLLQPDYYYHIYNHANGRENLFLSHSNYLFFLKKYGEHVSPIADTFAYCLMPNHFHIAIRIKSLDKLCESLKLSQSLDSHNISLLLSKQFSNLFSSYTQAFNKQNERRGGLFASRFKKKQIDNDVYFKRLIHYIHFNPVHHLFVNDLRDWKYSSFESYFSDKASRISREETISWFANRQAFWAFHQQEIDGKMILELEDD